MPIKEFDINPMDINLNEYYINLAWEKNLDQKIDLIAKEVLAYGFKNKNANCSIEEMIALSKFQFLETSYEQRLAYRISHEDEENYKLDDDLINPLHPNKDYKEKEKEFIKNPVKVIKEYAIEEANKEIDETDQIAVDWKNHCQQMVTKLTNIENPYLENEKKIQASSITLLVGRERYTGQNVTKCDAILKKAKGGFFERLFRRTSNEYKNFKVAFKNFNDKDNPNYGNREILKASAMAYLKHKFPNLDENEPIDYKLTENLTGTSLIRTSLCISVLDKLQYQDKMDTLENQFINPNKVNENEQNDFQKDINEAVEDKNLIKENIEEIDNNIVIDNELNKQ
jgi:hypothetical protein